MRFPRMAALAALLVLAGACSTYKSKPQMTYYHGPNIPQGYVSILRASPSEIAFEIRVEFPQKQMYHLVLDGNTPVAEGWFSTLRAGTQAYTVTMKLSDGKTFERGRTYRLCIGAQNPQAVQMTSSNYPCLIDHTFIFQEKS